MSDVFKIVENGNHPNIDKSQLHKSTVKEDLETSLTDSLKQSVQIIKPLHQEVEKNPEQGKSHTSLKLSDSQRSKVQDNITSEKQVVTSYGIKQPLIKEAERYSHINDVEGKHRASIGAVEESSYQSEVIGGAAGTATAEATANNIIKDSTKQERLHGSFIKGNNPDIKDGVSEAAAYEDKTWGSKGSDQNKSLIKGVGTAVIREVDKAVTRADCRDDLAYWSAKLSLKYGYRAGKYLAISGFSVGRGAYRIARYNNKLSKDVAAGVIDKKAANRALLDRTKKSISGSGGSVGKIIKGGLKRDIEDFHGSEDLGMQALTKPKDIVVKTKRSLSMVQTTGKVFKSTLKGTLSTGQKIYLKTQQMARAAGAAAKKLLSNPVVLKGAAIVAGLVVLVAVVVGASSAIASIVPTISLKSDDVELSKTYKYVTELDANLTEQIRSYPYRWENSHVDKFHYYVNDMEIGSSGDSITIETNADAILLYLDSKYDDYAFDKFIYGLFGGTNVKDEITGIHNTLYQVSTDKWEEEIEHTSTYTDEYGNSYDNTWYEIVDHMDISVERQSFDAYLSMNIDTLLTPDEQDKMEAIRAAGQYTTKKELGNPFKDTADSWGVSPRWGWRIHPTNGNLSDHTGIDIPMANGTPINNVMYGTVITATTDSGGYGKYVVIENGTRQVLYAHLNSISVNVGETVNKGAVIGTVGSTGNCTGNHLHIEYTVKGVNFNPQFYLMGAGAGSGLSDGSYAALIAEAEKYLGYPYVWGGSNPSTSFDCSGFICWVYTQSGVYNLPRTTAQGIYNQCTIIDESEVQPGDLVFFTGTYSSGTPVSHVGIYTGGGQMIHCGSPISYASIYSAYWQSHFYAFGRLN